MRDIVGIGNYVTIGMNMEVAVKYKQLKNSMILTEFPPEENYLNYLILQFRLNFVFYFGVK